MSEKEYPIIDEQEKIYVRMPLRASKRTAKRFVGVRKNQFVAVDVLLPHGYKHLVAPVGFDTKEQCQKACDVHNKFHGWTKEEADQIVEKSTSAEETTAADDHLDYCNHW